MRSLTPFGSARLHTAVGHNEVVIGHMVNATETQDFEAARLMIFVDIALAPGHCIFARNHRRVVNYDPGHCDCVEERNDR